VKRYDGKVALITGAGGGIGRATSLRLAEEGAAIGVLDIRREAAEETVRQVERVGARAVVALADVTDPVAIKGAVGIVRETLGGLDVLVNNAGYALKGNLEQVEPADWDKEVTVNLKGPYLCAKAALPGMLAQGHGVIINIGSVNGALALGNPAYSAAKAGLVSLTQALAVEYGPRGIRTNMVSPGTIETDIETWRIRREKNPQIFETLARWYPVGRVGRPEDVAAAVAYLAADEASFVNGANLMVDGGLTAGLPVMIEDMILETD
jgi:meso-butanediol dehydrogenase/(S,S)-butanediol dehydrogenase/diacetyl reductase